MLTQHYHKVNRGVIVEGKKRVLSLQEENYKYSRGECIQKLQKEEIKRKIFVYYPTYYTTETHKISGKHHI